MKSRIRSTPAVIRRRVFYRAYSLSLAALLLTACDGSKSPDWKISEVPDPRNLEQTSVSTVSAEKPDLPEILSEQAPADNPVQSSSTAGRPLRFVSYNVENWLTMDRFDGKKTQKNAPKPEIEKQAVIETVAAGEPDILGVSEIGTAGDLADLQERLKKSGFDLPHSHYVGGMDPVRHLGLLSRFPIIATAKPKKTEYRLGGQTYGINRGILDATIKLQGKPYRFLGVHLKSKRESEQGPQDAIRLNEARLLREHVDHILKTEPAARLIVYGDMNDTRPTPPIKLITGKYNDPGYLTAVPVSDSNKEAWTHYWEPHDIYSRIDFVMVSRSLREGVDFQASKIIDVPQWNVGSDHRPLLVIFK